MDIKKEIGDQAAHFAVGAALVMLIALWAPVPVAVIFTAAFAYLREVLQRLSRGDPWYECGPGCMLDLTFWLLGISMGAQIAIAWT